MKKPCKYKDSIDLTIASLNLDEKPVKEYKFHPVRKWQLDWAFPKKKLAIEYEGMPFFGKSRHTTIGGFSGDCEKYNELMLRGWRLLRFNATHVKSGLAHDQITRLLTTCGLCTVNCLGCAHYVQDNELFIIREQGKKLNKAK